MYMLEHFFSCTINVLTCQNALKGVWYANWRIVSDVRDNKGIVFGPYATSSQQIKVGKNHKIIRGDAIWENMTLLAISAYDGVNLIWMSLVLAASVINALERTCYHLSGHYNCNSRSDTNSLISSTLEVRRPPVNNTKSCRKSASTFD